jgi:ATP-dependent 26S proteasome regulatory subunit
MIKKTGVNFDDIAGLKSIK